ncbi:hypothetical protein NFHSH190041_00700 [Shewanella sp. NFH-SH190041]|nr:hypothetical protein NFHSH190041_00700 [Shewanella sp. NFH-SH190041]
MSRLRGCGSLTPSDTDYAASVVEAEFAATDTVFNVIGFIIAPAGTRGRDSGDRRGI